MPQKTIRERYNMYNPYNNRKITDIAPTQTTNCGNINSSSAVLIEENNKTNQKLEILDREVVNALAIVQKDSMIINKESYRIRKLTPKECWRLMGFDDEDFDKAKDSGISNSQLYKQARKFNSC